MITLKSPLIFAVLKLSIVKTKRKEVLSIILHNGTPFLFFGHSEPF